jgi:hypothetical protein
MIVHELEGLIHEAVKLQGQAKEHEPADLS